MREESSHEIRQNWGDVLNRVQREDGIIVSRFGRPVAVIISHERYQKLKSEAQEETEQCNKETS